MRDYMVSRYRSGCRKVKHAKPPHPWGPFCYLRRERHDEPFAKRQAGKLRRRARLFAQREIEAAFANI